ncbi:MAG: CinA family protein, partial [Candidatus Heimdallarchaeota archaeon]|nr:CinA family protein [Candidatus Heimdallarchaeota archaeon]
ILTKHNWTLSTAESCTGGYLASKITDVSGSSNYFSNGYITYSNESKFQNLDVPISSLEEFSVYSGKTVELMAEGVRKKTGTTFGIATTGIAPPGDNSTSLPTGTTFIGLSTAKSSTHFEFLIKNESRIGFKKKVVKRALNLLLLLICECEKENETA